MFTVLSLPACRQPLLVGKNELLRQGTDKLYLWPKVKSSFVYLV